MLSDDSRVAQVQQPSCVASRKWRVARIVSVALRAKGCCEGGLCGHHNHHAAKERLVPGSARVATVYLAFHFAGIRKICSRRRINQRQTSVRAHIYGGPNQCAHVNVGMLDTTRAAQAIAWVVLLTLQGAPPIE